MKSWKRFFAAVTAGLLCVGGMPALQAILPDVKILASAATYTFGNLSYKILEDETIEITDCDTSAVKAEIPAEIDGAPVTRIGDSAFQKCTELASVTIPDSVTSIGDEAFGDCTSLTSITIPDSVTEVGGGVFFQCEKLQSVELSNQMTTLPFYYDTQTLGYSGFFAGCYSLTEITLPDSVTSIGKAAFHRCRSLTTITIPESVTNIEQWAFEDCYALSSITLPENVTSIGERAFVSCYALASINIPDKVESIGANAFSYCESLTAIQIPASVTRIGFFAFWDCDNLTAITVSPDNPVYASYDGIVYDKNLENIIEVPFGIQQCTISDRVTEINNTSFYLHLNLVSVTIPDSVTSIKSGAFSMTALCDNQTGVKYADNWVIDCDEDITTAELRPETKGIGDSAFYECADLSTITVPDTVTNIGSGAFQGCNNLTDVYYAGTIDQWQTITISEEKNEPLFYATIHCSDGDIAPEIRLGDVDASTAVDPDDAYLCLLAYAKQSVGSDSGLTVAQMKAADVDGDGSITPNDAYYILLYYAKQSVGQDVTWEDIL
ncbi:leucine-rich repeat protein [uncultured Ruminococcus sp.]|uniref:leucine-rich repeat protein n=1 Tax=uncultured Ruminococcus sp. TaxID=165186 RepID=UPI00261DF359|nr:leucine-rich repeat protein [uncultured Ruminococcus sp.]